MVLQREKRLYPEPGCMELSTRLSFIARDKQEFDQKLLPVHRTNGPASFRAMEWNVSFPRETLNDNSFAS